MQEAKRGRGELSSWLLRIPLLEATSQPHFLGQTALVVQGLKGWWRWEMELEVWGLAGRSLDRKVVSWFQRDSGPTLTSWEGMPWDKKS